MEKRRFLCLSLLLLFCLSAIQAQWDAPFSHYWAVRGFYNPAFAGETDQIRTAAVYRYQWAGIDNAPQRVVLTADMPVAFFQRRHGAGIVASSEQLGSLRNTLLAGQYSFRQELGEGALQLGLQAGICNLQYDAGSLQFIPGEEPYERGILRVNTADKQQADLNAGIAWSGKQFYAGLSVLHLTEPGCAIRAALDAGTIPPERLDSYFKLKAEQAAKSPRQLKPGAHASAPGWRKKAEEAKTRPFRHRQHSEDE